MEAFERAWGRLVPYHHMGYGVLPLSLRMSKEVDREHLLKHLDGKTTLVLGPSGAGKSTLINLLVPQAQAVTGEAVVSPDWRTVTVQLQTFDKTGELNEKALPAFTAGVNHRILAETGASYVLSPKKHPRIFEGARGMLDDERNKPLVDAATSPTQVALNGQGGSLNTPAVAEKPAVAPLPVMTPISAGIISSSVRQTSRGSTVFGSSGNSVRSTCLPASCFLTSAVRKPAFLNDRLASAASSASTPARASA